jgi:hypothetical protein
MRLLIRFLPLSLYSLLRDTNNQKKPSLPFPLYTMLQGSSLSHSLFLPRHVFELIGFLVIAVIALAL